MKKLIIKIKIILGIMKKVKLKKGPCGSKSSNNPNIGSCAEFILGGAYNECNSYLIKNLDGTNAGWVYDYEIENFCIKIEDFQNEKNALNEKLTEVNAKLKWMEETGVTDFDEKEFNVYQTLTLLEDESISKIEKTKLIAKLIK